MGERTLNVRAIGDKSVIDRMKAGEMTDVIVTGGAHSGVVSLGMLLGLLDLDCIRLSPRLRLIGMSIGAVNGATLLDDPRKLERSAEVFRHVAETGLVGFARSEIRIPRTKVGFGNPIPTPNLDIGGLVHLLQGMLDAERVSMCRSPLHIAVTDRVTGTSWFHRADAENLFDLFRITMAVPGFCKASALPGTMSEMVDGCIGFCAKKMIAALRAPNALILLNRVFHSERGFFERYGGDTITRRVMRDEPKQLLNTTIAMDRKMQLRVAELLARNGRTPYSCRTLVLAPDDNSIPLLVQPRDAALLPKWCDAARHATVRALQ